MKASICDDCLKNGDLCEDCKEKVEEGEIAEEAVEISRFLYSLKDEYKYLEEVEISRILVGENVIIIVTPEEDVGKVVGKGGEVVKLLAKEWNRAIRVVEKSEDIREFAESLLPDVKIFGVNKVYSPEEDYSKIAVSEEDENKIMINREEFAGLVEYITGEKVELSFS